VQEFGTVAPFFTVYFHLYVNPTWLDGLPEDLRQIVLEEAKEAEQEVIEITERTAEQAITDLNERGMTLHIQTDEEAEAFKAVMQPPVLEAFKASSPDAERLIGLAEAL
jgi:C4-dicarboxylate-binding protein DctP